MTDLTAIAKYADVILACARSVGGTYDRFSAVELGIGLTCWHRPAQNVVAQYEVDPLSLVEQAVEEIRQLATWLHGEAEADTPLEVAEAALRMAEWLEEVLAKEDTLQRELRREWFSFISCARKMLDG
jgi:hypothetical protein